MILDKWTICVSLLLSYSHWRRFFKLPLSAFMHFSSLPPTGRLELLSTLSSNCAKFPSDLHREMNDNLGGSCLKLLRKELVLALYCFVCGSLKTAKPTLEWFTCGEKCVLTSVSTTFWRLTRALCLQQTSPAVLIGTNSVFCVLLARKLADFTSPLLWQQDWSAVVGIDWKVWRTSGFESSSAGSRKLMYVDESFGAEWGMIARLLGGKGGGPKQALAIILTRYHAPNTTSKNQLRSDVMYIYFLIYLRCVYFSTSSRNKSYCCRSNWYATRLDIFKIVQNTKVALNVYGETCYIWKRQSFQAHYILYRLFSSRLIRIVWYCFYIEKDILSESHIRKFYIPLRLLACNLTYLW